jgi:hypothetical protein
MNDKVKALFLAANPIETTPLSLDEETRKTRIQIERSQYPDRLELIYEFAVRPDDLLHALNRHRPQLVHFSGHGSRAGELILVSDNGESKPVSPEGVKDLFVALKDNIRVVVFNACNTRTLAESVSEVIDCAIGMNGPIGDQSAIIFAASFYRALGFGRSVQEAFLQGRVALRIEGCAEHETPQLLTKRGVDPARLFLISAASTPQDGPRDEHSDLLDDYLSFRLADLCNAWFKPYEHFEFHPRDHFITMGASWHDGSRATDLVEDIQQRLAAGKQLRLVVSANYGQGKTFLGWRLALTLAANADRSHVPFFYPLRAFSPNTADDPFAQISNYFRSQIDECDLAKLFATRDCLLILDGVDEMPMSSATAKAVTEILRSIFASLGRFTRLALLVTFRTGLFPQGLEQFRKAFPAFAGATLEPWDQSNWEQLLERCETNGLVSFDGGWRRFRDEVASRSLVDLTTRPLWCRMIVETRHTVLAAHVSGEAGLYEFYVQDYFRKTMEKSGASQLLSPTQKLQVMELLAAKMAQRTGSRSRKSRVYVNDDDLIAVAANTFHLLPGSDFTEYIVHDLRTYSLLNHITLYLPQSSEYMTYYTFGHNSFEHFFQARAFLHALSKNVQPEAASIISLVEILGLARQLDTNDPVFDFAYGLLGGDAKLIEDIRRCLCRDPATLFGALTDDVNDVRKVLFRLWIELERKMRSRQTVDLTGFRLEKLTLSRMNLSHCRFAHANLNSAKLGNCDLTDSDFTEAKCRNTDFTRARLDGANFEGADLRGAIGLPPTLPTARPGDTQ